MIREKWSVGRFVITRICESEVAVPGGDGSLLPDATPEALARLGWLRPHFVTADGMLVMSIHALLIETPDVRLVVDTCVGNDKPRHLPGFSNLATNFLDCLRETGWTPESVDGVLCTHLHVDHVGWNTMRVDGRWVPTFRNAKYYFGRREYDFWLSTIADGGPDAGIPPDVRFALDDQTTFEDSIRPVAEAGLVELVEMDAELAPGVSLLPTPGHTPGHVSVCLESEGERALITGDTFHHPCQIGRPDWRNLFDFSEQEAGSTRMGLLEAFANSDVLVIGTHFATPTAGWITTTASGFEFHVTRPQCSDQ